MSLVRVYFLGWETFVNTFGGEILLLEASKTPLVFSLRIHFVSVGDLKNR